MSTEEFLLARIRGLEAEVLELKEREAGRLVKLRSRVKKCRVKRYGNVTVTLHKKTQQNQQSGNVTVTLQGGVYKEMVKPSLKKDIYTRGIPEPDFEEFWKLYPRHIGRAEATKAYGKARKRGAPKEEILKGVSTLRSSQTELKFVPHASTWLNQCRWEDDAAHISPKNNVIKINKSGIPGVDW